ncbi:Zinc finger swim domain-containing protein 1 [Plakobranchus ocellatus]|uniref:Zinc finger swim domain-containing protein 1 n=1 Tax=Plakobranchus ocellatus TaxID=259542 RepID=A0AAV4ATS6_9GAST|nr:Zinc finger swim domain-containing protein 1 [Plakobranchus ocellatus]
MVVDHEGHGMPVFHAFLAKEDSHIMEKCLRIFALQYNSEHTSCFIVDKDMAEITAIGAIFSGVPVNLCHFHISQAVERYLRKALGRSASVVKLLTSSFMKQVCTESEEEFDALKREISQIVPQSVIQYFEDNWWSKRHLCAACCNVNVIKFHANTTNALESYHSKI